MKKILVPVDFTPASRNAAEYAAALAKKLAADVYLLHVFLEPAPVNEVPFGWVHTDTSLHTENKVWLQQEAQFLMQKYAINVVCNVQEGYTNDTISRVAHEIDSSLIVMGIQQGARRLFLGSTTARAIQKNKRPVLLVPHTAAFRPIRHIVLASDFSRVRRVACWQPFIKFVTVFDAAVQVLHIQPKGVSLTASNVQGIEQMERVLNKISYSYKQLEADTVTQGILNFVQSHPADLLVMVAHAHGLAKRLFGTTHTHAMSYQTNLPLLILEDR